MVLERVREAPPGAAGRSRGRQPTAPKVRTTGNQVCIPKPLWLRGLQCISVVNLGHNCPDCWRNVGFAYFLAATQWSTWVFDSYPHFERGRLTPRLRPAAPFGAMEGFSYTLLDEWWTARRLAGHG